MGRARHIQHQAPVRERDNNAALRAAAAYQLWLDGMPFAAIAQQLGYANESGARKAWKRARDAMPAPPDLEAERERERARLELDYHVAILPKIREGSLWAVDRHVAVSARKAALLGLDAARDAELAGPAQVKVIVRGQLGDTPGETPHAAE